MEAKVGFEPTWTALQTVASPHSATSPWRHFRRRLLSGLGSPTRRSGLAQRLTEERAQPAIAPRADKKQAAGPLGPAIIPGCLPCAGEIQAMAAAAAAFPQWSRLDVLLVENQRSIRERS